MTFFFSNCPENGCQSITNKLLFSTKLERKKPPKNTDLDSQPPHVMFPQRIVVISHSTKVLSHIWAEVYTSKWRNEQGLTGFDRKELMLTVPQLEADEGQSWALCALTAGPGHKVRALKQTTQKHRLCADLLQLCSWNSVAFLQAWPRLESICHHKQPSEWEQQSQADLTQTPSANTKMWARLWKNKIS